MKIRFFLFIFSVLCFMGCRQVTIDFSYAPLSPRSGDTVRFTNLSTNGEDYEWNFGDNHTATTKSATHIFPKAGTYPVTLTETHTNKTCTHVVSVVDSLPSVAFSSDSICRYDSVWIYAQVWNPFRHTVGYQWTLDEHTRLLAGGYADDSICVLFTRATTGFETNDAQVSLAVTMDDTCYIVKKSVTVYEKKTWAILMRTESDDWYQTAYLPYYDAPERLTNLSDAVSFDAATARTALDEALPLQQVIDPMEQKKYYGGSSGLYVSHINGTSPVCLTTDSVGTMVLDVPHQRIYYSTDNGVYALPLIYTANNQPTKAPSRINSLNHILTILTMD